MWQTYGLRRDDLRQMRYGELMDFAAHIYEQNRDEHNLDPEAESAYQNRQFRKMLKERDGRQHHDPDTR